LGHLPNPWKLDSCNAWTAVYAFAGKEIKTKSQQSKTAPALEIKYPRRNNLAPDKLSRERQLQKVKGKLGARHALPQRLHASV
jgi:hypothetical protein